MFWIFSISALKLEEKQSLGPIANSWQPPTPDGVKIDPLQVAHAGNISLEMSLSNPVVFLIFLQHCQMTHIL